MQVQNLYRIKHLVAYIYIYTVYRWDKEKNSKGFRLELMAWWLIVFLAWILTVISEKRTCAFRACGVRVFRLIRPAAYWLLSQGGPGVNPIRPSQLINSVTNSPAQLYLPLLLLLSFCLCWSVMWESPMLGMGAKLKGAQLGAEVGEFKSSLLLCVLTNKWP